VRTAGLLQSQHRDPFDRLLAAQARIEDLTLVTADAHVASLCATVL
jgi:PIN domain nuclease of toxin-antitoxin system